MGRFGTVAIVVNNAGIAHKNQPLLDVDEKTVDRVYAVNVKSIFYMTHAIVPLMRQRRSAVILNVGSVAGIPSPDPLAEPHSCRSSYRTHTRLRSLCLELAA